MADNNAHRILEVDPALGAITSFIGSGQGGEFNFPSRVKNGPDGPVVLDREALKWIDKDGRVDRVLRTFYTMLDFAFDQDCEIYINPMFRGLSPDKPLIVHLNAEGSKLREFGLRSLDKRYRGRDNRAFLAIGGDRLFVAFRHRPLLQVFSLRGGEKEEQIRIEHPIFDRLSKAYENVSNDDPRRLWLPSFIAGLSSVGERVFVLLDIPDLEVLEFDLSGRELDRHRSKLTPDSALSHAGFDAQAQPTGYQFAAVLRDHTTSRPFLILAATSEDLAGLRLFSQSAQAVVNPSRPNWR